MILPKDPYICLSVINTKLRDGAGDRDELCAAEDIDREELTALLGQIGYIYEPEANQFIRRQH